LSLSDEALSSRQIDELIERANDPEFIQNTLRQAAVTERKGGRSMVPVYLDELTTHAARVQKPMVEPLLSALFEIHDEIDLKKDADKGLWRMANTSQRLRWLIRRLTRGRFSIDVLICIWPQPNELPLDCWSILSRQLDVTANARINQRQKMIA
jgi:hypothetical protein